MRITAEGLVVALAAAVYLVGFNISRIEYVVVAGLVCAALHKRPLCAVGLGILGIACLAWAFPTQADARLELWFVSLMAWLDKPLLGWGIGSFDWAFAYHRNDYGAIWGKTILTTPNVLAGAAHNAAVQTLVELGLIGCFAAAAVAVLVLRNARDANAKVALLVALICMMIGLPEHNPFTAALIAVAGGVACGTAGPVDET